MPSITEAAKTQVGRKILTAITGLALAIFIIFHLIGNLMLFGGPQAFNEYTLKLESMGWLLYLAEAVLALFFLVHAYEGIVIYLRKRKARPQNYAMYKSKGDPSRQSLSSRSMIFTGIVLLVFLVIHLKTFKYGETETVIINGQQARDLKTLVIDTFQDPLYAFGYTFVMILLGFHLGHGVWSAFTSLTVSDKRLSGVIYAIGIIFAILMAVGFIFIPLYIYFTGGQGVLISY